MNNFIRSVLLLAGIALAAYLIWYFRSIMAYILVAGVLSIIGRPLVDLLGKIRIRKWYLPRALRALLTILVIYTLVFAFFRVFIPLIVSQGEELSQIDEQELVAFFEGPLEEAEGLFQQFYEGEEEISLGEFLQDQVGRVLNISVIRDIFGSIAGALGNIFVALFAITFATFFFLRDQQLFKQIIMAAVPEKYESNARRALASIKHLLTRYFIGIIIQSTLVMTLITTGMVIVGLKFEQAIVIGLIAGVLNVIPYIGPWIGGAIAITIGIATHLDYDFSTQLLPMIFYMLIVIVSIQLTDNMVFQPTIFSNSVRAHPLEIFIVIMIAGSLAGVAGMVLAIPTYTVVRVLAREFFNQYKVVRKITNSIKED